MADSWTLPATYTHLQAVTAADMNLIRDNLEALKAGQTDSSSDSDIWTAVKSGTLAARAAVTHKVGRQYVATNLNEVFISDGTNWRHTGGQAAHDDFTRAAGDFASGGGSGVLSKSGHTWAEVSGDWDIIAGAAPPVNYLAITGATTARASLDTASLLDIPFHVRATFVTHTTQGSISNGVFVKFVDANNYICVTQDSGALGVYKNIASSGDVTVATKAFSPAAGQFYELDIAVNGQSILATITGENLTGVKCHARHDDIDHAAFAAATKVGLRLVNVNPANTGFTSIAVTFD